MGQCYFVRLKLNIENEAEFIRLTNEYINNAKNVRFNDYKPDSVDNIARIFLAAQQGGFEIIDDNTYEAEFHATYGWETVLEDFFTTVKSTLCKGSYITVYPDSGSWTKEV